MLKKLTLERAADDDVTTYLNVGRFRLIFKNGKYMGWYNAKLSRVLK